jgi:hypothetical protein
MSKLKLRLFILFISISTVVSAQTSIVFVPEVYGTTLNGLFRASIFNASGVKSVRMNITVTEARAGKIATIQTGVFTIAPGNNIIPSGVARTANTSPRAIMNIHLIFIQLLQAKRLLSIKRLTTKLHHQHL